MKGFDVNTQDPLNGHSILHYLAIVGGPLDMIAWLVKEKGANVNLKYSSLLFLQAVLVEFPSSCLIDRNRGANTPLHVALEYEMNFAARLLLELGADINAVGRGLKTPLHYLLQIKKDITTSSCTSFAQWCLLLWY